MKIAKVIKYLTIIPLLACSKQAVINEVTKDEFEEEATKRETLYENECKYTKAFLTLSYSNSFYKEHHWKMTQERERGYGGYWEIAITHDKREDLDIDGELLLESFDYHMKDYYWIIRYFTYEEQDYKYSFSSSKSTISVEERRDDGSQSNMEIEFNKYGLIILNKLSGTYQSYDDGGVMISSSLTLTVKYS